MTKDEIIKEQARLLKYVIDYSGVKHLLPDGLVEDCRAVQAEAERSTNDAAGEQK